MSLPPAVFLLLVTRAEVGSMLRADALYIGLGLLLVAVGIASVAVYARSPREGPSALPWFGIFTFLYGLRLLARSDTFPLLFDLPPRFWLFLAAAITYVVPLPMLLLLRIVFPRWRRPLGWAAVLVGGFAVCALAADAHLRRPYSAQTPNNLIAIAFMAISLPLLFRADAAPSRDLATLRVGLVSLAATAVVDNLRGLQLLSWPHFDVEPLGSTILIAGLGRIAARRVFKDAERLLALDRELRIARGIQSSILPTAMPKVGGLVVAARYQPMTAVAGDFYDFLELGPRRLGVLVADVSGHGVPAALIASMVKVAIAAQRLQADSPAAVLAGMNRTLQGQLGGQYATAAYLFLDREAGVMRYSAAGHPPLLRWRGAEAQAREIEENSLPLGMMDIVHYGQLEQPLQVGDRFLLYTDGLLEATNAAGEFFDMERVKSAIADCAERSTERAADLIVEKTLGWTEGRAADDLTLVLVDCV
jgi:sigma-B regulation protein RsbU (phosphoserine phosphatase)